jgi:hypothetical protein
MLTAMFGMIAIYWFAMFGYFYLNDHWYMDSVGYHGESICTTPIQCFLVAISYVLDCYA